MMRLLRSQTFEHIGSWLFRYRSFLAFAAVPIVAFGFKSFSFLERSHSVNESWQILCFFVAMSGLALRAFTVGRVPRGTSGRNTFGQLASSLNTTGMYSVVRHPLYLGNYLAALGCLMFFHNIWIVFAGTCLFGLLYLPIIFSEECFLRKSFGQRFESWARATPALIPRWSLWRPPTLPFCWRAVLNREYTGLCVVCIVFFLFDVVGDWVAEDRFPLDGWSVVLMVGGLIYLTLRSLKKRTQLLDVEGR